MKCLRYTYPGAGPQGMSYGDFRHRIAATACNWIYLAHRTFSWLPLTRHWRYPHERTIAVFDQRYPE
ncbi:MAG: hypothetical protein IPL86_13375 [Flavobacteriales bacterium]|nr:hypothetical protein [Flavobacteriales bacterium]